MESPDDFSKGDNQVEFIKSISDFLKISDDLIKILKVNSLVSRRLLIQKEKKLAEVVVSFMIEGSDLTSDPSYSSIKDQKHLDELANKLKEEIKKDNSKIVTGAKQIIQFDFTTLVSDASGSVSEKKNVDKDRKDINVVPQQQQIKPVKPQEEDIPLVIIMIVILILMVIIIAIVIVYFYMKNKIKHLPIKDNDLNDTQENVKNNNHYLDETFQKNKISELSSDHSEDIDSGE